MALNEGDLDECEASGQWRCTVEELQQLALRLLREKRGMQAAYRALVSQLNSNGVHTGSCVSIGARILGLKGYF